MFDHVGGLLTPSWMKTMDHMLIGPIEDYCDEKRFILMPRIWLKEAEVINRFQVRIKNYANVPCTTGAYSITGNVVEDTVFNLLYTANPEY